MTDVPLVINEVEIGVLSIPEGLDEEGKKLLAQSTISQALPALPDAMSQVTLQALVYEALGLPMPTLPNPARF